MKINQDTPFTTKTIRGTGGIIYALANHAEVTDGEGRVSYTAEAIAVDSPADADKAIKNFMLSSMTVTTTAGNVFDGNETARNNMLSAIQSASFLGQTEATWKLADNSSKIVTLDELKEALALSITKVGEIVTA